MARTLLLAMIVVSTLRIDPAGAQASRATDASPRRVYVCPPCGCDADHREFTDAGECPVCGMQLVERPDAPPPARPASVPAPASGGDPMPPRTGRIPVAFVMTEGATMIDFAGPWEVFQDVSVRAPESAAERAPFLLYTVSESRQPIRTSGGMTVVPDYTFEDAPAPKVVVVGAQRGSPKLSDWLRKVAGDSNTDAVISVCTGAFKLGEAGLLDGKPATTHHDFYDSFQARFPAVRLERGRRFVRSDARIFTAGGLTSGIDLALHVVERYFGRGAAQQTADYMEYQGTGWREASR